MCPVADDRMTNVIGDFPYRMAFAGGWIDQPFVSEKNIDTTSFLSF